MAVTIGPDGSSGTSTPTASPTQTTTTTTVKPAATVYWFNGKAYYSYEAYLAAVEAYQQLLMKQQAAARQAATLAAQQASALTQQQQAAQVLLQQQAAERARLERYKQAALLAARDRALELERQAALERQLRQQELAAKAAASQRMAQMRAAEDARRRAILAADAQAELREAEALRRRRAELQAEAARRAAYEEMQRQAIRMRNQLQLQETRGERDAELAQAAREAALAAELERRKREGLGGEDVPGTYIKARNSMVTRANQTGDFTLIIDWLDQQSRNTGGRFVDDALLKYVDTHFVRPVLQVGEDYRAEVEKIMDLIEADDIEGASAIIFSDEFLRLEEEFVKWFGDDREEGAFADPAQTLTEISERRRRLWIAQMTGAATTASQSEIDRLVQRVEQEAAFGDDTAMGGHFAGEQAGRAMSEWVDAPQYDPETGIPTGETKREQVFGVDAWIARQEQMQLERMRAIERQQDLWVRQARKEGYTDPHFEDGVFVYTDPQQAQLVEQLFGPNGNDGWMPPKWSLSKDGSGIPVIIQRALDDGNPVLAQRLQRDFMNDARMAFDQNNQALRQIYQTYGPVHGRQDLGFMGGWGGIQWMTARNQWLRRVAEAVGYDWNPWNQLVLTPPGELLEALMLPGAGVISAIRILAMLAGNQQRPYIGFDQPEDSRGLLTVPAGILGLLGLNLTFGSRYDEGAEEQKQQFLRAFGTGDASVMADAIRFYGMNWVQGNLGWLLEGAADPTLGLPLIPGSRAARLVAGERALGLSSPGRFGSLMDFYSYAFARPAGSRFRLPGTFTGQMTDTAWAKLHQLRSFGVDARAMARLPEDEWLAALEARRTPGKLEETTWWRTLLASMTGRYQKAQLLRMMEQELPEIARALGIGVPDVFQMMARIKELRRRMLEATNLAEEAERLTAAQAKRAAALAATRRAGLQVPRSVALEYGLRNAGRMGTARQIARQVLEQERLLVAEFEKSATDYLAVARRGQAAADALEAGLRARDVRGLSTLRAQLDDAWRRTKDFTDEYNWDPGVSDYVVRTRTGLVHEQLRRVQDFRNRIGGDPTAPRMDKVTQRALRADQVTLRRRIQALRSRLPTASPADRRTILAQIRELQHALAGVRYEQALLNKGRDAYRQLARREIKRVRDLISPQRVAHVAQSQADQSRELARDFYALLQSTEDSAAARFTPEMTQQFDDARRLLAEPLDWSDPRLKPFRDRMEKALQFMPGDMSIEEAFILLSSVLMERGGRAYATAYRAVQAQVFDAMRRSGVTHMGTAAGRADRLRSFRLFQREAHLRSGVRGRTLAEFEPLDSLVAMNFHNFGIGRRKGQFRPGRRRFSDPQNVYRLLSGDVDPERLWIKMRSLQANGVGLWEYDDLRAVLSPLMVKKNTTQSLLRDAKAAAATSGRSVEEELIDLRLKRRDLEATDRFVEYASRFENKGMSPQMILRQFEEEMISRDLLQTKRRSMTAFQREALERSFVDTTGFASDDLDQVAKLLQEGGAGGEALPMTNRTALREWLVRHGYWSPRTGEVIAQGDRVWSVSDERQFFERNFAWSPIWTDPRVLRPLLDDPRLLRRAFEEWGFFDESYEELVSGLDLTVRMEQEALAYGKGVKRQRTAEELRQWMIQRYGDLVADGNGGLIRAPWLMRAGDEYERWWDRVTSEVGKELHEAELLRARADLPEALRDEIFEGNHLSRAGAELTRGLVTGAESRAFAEAVKTATMRRIERMRKVAPTDPDPALWLPQERLLFAYDMMFELMRTRSWQRRITALEAGGLGLAAWATFWRMLVSFTVAFPIMNLIDSFGGKRFLLSIFENNGRFIGRDADGLATLGEEPARRANLSSRSVFGVNDRNGFRQAGDEMLPLKMRALGGIRGVAELPLDISRWGEDRLRDDMLWTVAGNAYRAARTSGMAEASARILARGEAERVGRRLFASVADDPITQFLNLMFPFFSYNFNLKILALKLVVNHPAIWIWGERIRAAVERSNREAWEEENPGVPFPEGPSASWFWIKHDDGTFTQIDLTSMSDWSRAMTSMTANETAVGWFQTFLRVPHTSQQAFWAMVTGGMTPWGKPGSWRELSPWVDLLWWMQGNDYRRQEWQRDATQILSQILFFKSFGRITPLTIQRQVFRGLLALDRERAFAYLDAHPDLALYYKMRREDRLAQGVEDPEWFQREARVSWRDTLTEAERDEYDAAFEGWKALNERLDLNIVEHANEPWTDAYRAEKKAAFLARTLFLRDHPILTESWGLFMSPAEFANFWEDFHLDQMVDAWFNWPKPKRADFASELEYQQALVAYYQRREDYLDANPALYRRLYQGQSAIENAWHEQELHWSEILEFQSKLKVKILEEEAKEDGANRDLIEFFYRVGDITQQELNAESYEVLFGEIDNGTMAEEWSKRRSVGEIMGTLGVGGLLKRVTQIPGFADFLFEKASPEERAEIERNERYAEGIARIVRMATSGQNFYELLQQDPWLLAEYWRRNPDKKASFMAGREYFRWITAWVARLKASDFDGASAIWAQMPDWVKARYFAKHPDSKMRDGIGGVSQGQQYFAALSRWVELLKAKRFDEAERYFNNLPDWVKERYYQNHPEQRAQTMLDLAALRAGADYFLASGDDKLRVLQANPELRAWLAKYGGDEAAMRGLILAIYRAIPSSEAWLKRTFRQRFPEVFGVEAAGARRLRSVARKLAENPEILPFYQKAFALQSQLFREQVKMNKTPPKPVTMERRQRMNKRRRRRAARLHSTWTLHRDLRLGR